MVMKGTAARGALFSADGTYRYLLWAELSDDRIRQAGGTPRDGTLLFCGLNPSTADEVVSDPTCTREMIFTAREGYRKYLKWNLFAYRSTDPSALRGLGGRSVGEGRDNLTALDMALGERPALVVAAWGTHGGYWGQDMITLRALEGDHRCGRERLVCLRVTKRGFPEHPLYLAATTPFKSYSLSLLEEAQRGSVPRGTSFPSALRGTLEHDRMNGGAETGCLPAVKVPGVGARCGNPEHWKRI